MGKSKYIETPEFFGELFDGYFNEVKSNPRTKVEYVGKDGERVETPLETPLTMVGFENYVFMQGYNVELSQYFANREGRYEDYVPICSRVKGRIRQDQIEGGMVGQYNASITQRLNGLTDKQDIEVKGQVSPFKPFDIDVSEDNGTS
jgi:hypothetical protein